MFCCLVVVLALTFRYTLGDNERPVAHCIDDDATCTRGCQPGYRGSFCNETCSEHCGGACSQDTGHCLTGCKPNWFTSNCSQPCSGNCVDDVCDRRSAECIRGCKNGFYGLNCNETCSGNCTEGKCDINGGCHCKKGVLDKFCYIDCTDNCIGGLCAVDHDGQLKCLKGCKEGRMGAFCKEWCPYDCPACDSTCVSRVMKRRSIRDSPNNCRENSKCKDGYRGPDCNKTCQACRYDRFCNLFCAAGSWGERCHSHCPKNCARGLNDESFCNSSHGLCDSGCDQGYYGYKCNHTCPTSCHKNVCFLYNGSCHEGCDPEYWGPKCEHRCGKCKDMKCEQNGSCTCIEGYYGPRCEVKCSDRCKGNCSITMNGSHICDTGCVTGFTGVDCQARCPSECRSGCSKRDGTCSDIDECTDKTDNCDNNALCENEAGGFTCTCNEGFTGGGITCTDIDECTDKTDNCDNNALCENAAGGFTCTCNEGFTGGGITCTDLNECGSADDNSCDTNGFCINNPGSYDCACNDGYSGDGFSCSGPPETPLHFKVINSTTESVTLSWTPQDTGGDFTQKFRVEYRLLKDISADWSSREFPLSQNNSGFGVVDGLDSNTGYVFRIKSVTDMKIESSVSKDIYVSTKGMPLPPVRKCISPCRACHKDSPWLCLRCETGKYGQRCDHICSNCLGNRCSMNGDCIDGCKSNWWGLKCDSKCQCDYDCDRLTGQYEAYVSLCPRHCKNVYQPECRNCITTGQCLYGCEDGFTGSRCELSLVEEAELSTVSPKPTSSCDPPCIQCNDDSTCVECSGPNGEICRTCGQDGSCLDECGAGCIDFSSSSKATTESIVEEAELSTVSPKPTSSCDPPCIQCNDDSTCVECPGPNGEICRTCGQDGSCLDECGAGCLDFSSSSRVSTESIVEDMPQDILDQIEQLFKNNALVLPLLCCSLVLIVMVSAVVAWKCRKCKGLAKCKRGQRAIAHTREESLFAKCGDVYHELDEIESNTRPTLPPRPPVQGILPHPLPNERADHGHTRTIQETQDHTPNCNGNDRINSDNETHQYDYAIDCTENQSYVTPVHEPTGSDSSSTRDSNLKYVTPISEGIERLSPNDIANLNIKSTMGISEESSYVTAISEVEQRELISRGEKCTDVINEYLSAVIDKGGKHESDQLETCSCTEPEVKDPIKYPEVRDQLKTGTCTEPNVRDQLETGTCTEPNVRDQLERGTCSEPDVIDQPETGTCTEPNVRDQLETGTCTEPDVIDQPETGTCTEPEVRDQLETGTCTEPNVRDQLETGTCTEPNVRDQLETGTCTEPNVRDQLETGTCTEPNVRDQLETGTCTEPDVIDQPELDRNLY